MLWFSAVAMAVPQITIRLSPARKAEFEQYAERVGLDVSALARLLIVREEHQRRLARLAHKGIPNRPRRVPGTGEGMPKVTAHFSSVEAVAEFDAYAKKCGLTRGSAGAWLVETELNERWLEKAIHSKIV